MKKRACGVQDTRKEIERVKIEEERKVAEMKRDVERNLEERRREIVLQEATLAQQREQGEVQAAALQKREESLRVLSMKYAAAEVVEEKSKGLDAREEQLCTQAAQVCELKKSDAVLSFFWK
jgi:hypothetical protein